MDLVQAAKIIGYDYIPAPEQIRELIIRAAARVAELEVELDIERDLTNKALDKLAELATNLEDQLAAAQERERVLNDDLKFALELAVAYAPNIKDQEWAAELIEQMDSPTPSQEADDEQD